jgi:hypothetical protein
MSDEVVAYAILLDGSRRPVFEGPDGQYVLDDDGQRVHGVWFSPRHGLKHVGGAIKPAGLTHEQCVELRIARNRFDAEAPTHFRHVKWEHFKRPHSGDDPCFWVFVRNYLDLFNLVAATEICFPDRHDEIDELRRQQLLETVAWADTHFGRRVAAEELLACLCEIVQISSELANIIRAYFEGLPPFGEIQMHVRQHSN